MGFEWVAIGLGDVAWIALAFAFGLVSRAIGLPPLVGFSAGAHSVFNMYSEAGAGFVAHVMNEIPLHGGIPSA